MASRSLLVLVTSLLCAGGTIFSLPATAETPLTQAIIQRLRNEVKLHPKQKQSRTAQKADVLTPGDALSTYRRAMAELRFNDRSLARIGEQAIFQFEPNTRSFDLRRGTVLLLIQPGQGRTRVRTPNAAAGIRGSALFIRYIEDSQVTMLGALTDSDIEITNNDGKTVVLKAGQMAYVYKDQIGVYNFDQKLFQETSPLFKEIDWNEAPTEVKAELDAALEGKAAIAGKYEDSPAWTKLAENRSLPAIAATAPVQQFVMPDRPNEGFYPNPSERSPANISNNPGVQQPLSPPTFTSPATSPSISSEQPAQPNQDSVDRGGRPSIVIQAPVPAQPVPGSTQQPSTPVQVAPPPQITQPPAQIVQPTEPSVQPPAQIAQPPASAPQPITQPSVPTIPTPPIAVTPPQPQTPPASQIPSANNPPTRPIAAPPPTQTPPVVTPPIGGRPSPVITPPVATPALPAIPTAATGQPTVPAVPAVPPTPVTPITAPTLVNTAPVAASTPPPAIVTPPAAITPPAVATPPVTPPVAPTAPATPPATAPMDMPAVQAVTTTAPAVTTTPAATTAPANATPAVNTTPAITIPFRTVVP